MCACYVHDHDYCRSSATDINQQDRPWGLLMAAKIPFWFSRDITLHVTDSFFENNESIHSHFVIFECQWTSILDITKGIKKIINQLQCYTQDSQSFWKNFLFPQLGVQTWISYYYCICRTFSNYYTRNWQCCYPRGKCWNPLSKWAAGWSRRSERNQTLEVTHDQLLFQLYYFIL